MPEAVVWTVMVYLNGDNDLERFAIKDFYEMSEVGSTENVNVLVQINRNGVYATTRPQWSQCLRVKVEKGMEPIPNYALEDLGEVNMGGPASLGNFVGWSMRNFPAKKYFLDIWDHGQGLRIAESITANGAVNEIRVYKEFRRKVAVDELNSKAAHVKRSDNISTSSTLVSLNLLAIPASRVIESSYRCVSHDDTNNDKLYNREIQDVLIKTLNWKKIDVIGFDACLMGMIETAYALREVGDAMVGSEELEPGDGLNYSIWLNELINYPTMTSSDLDKVLVDSYKHLYTQVNRDPDVTLSAINLNYYTPLAVALNALVVEMMNSLPVEFSNIQKARSNCSAYAPGYGLHGIDLARFCQQLHDITTNAYIKAKTRNVLSSISTSVVANFAGNGRKGNYGSHGLAIYFPESRALFITDPDSIRYLKANSVYPVEFVQKFKWRDSLQSYYSYF